MNVKFSLPFCFFMFPVFNSHETFFLSRKRISRYMLIQNYDTKLGRWKKYIGIFSSVTKATMKSILLWSINHAFLLKISTNRIQIFRRYQVRIQDLYLLSKAGSNPCENTKIFSWTHLITDQKYNWKNTWLPYQLNWENFNFWNN